MFKCESIWIINDASIIQHEGMGPAIGICNSSLIGALN